MADWQEERGQGSMFSKQARCQMRAIAHDEVVTENSKQDGRVLTAILVVLALSLGYSCVNDENLRERLDAIEQERSAQ